MGIITNLIKMNTEKKAKDAATQADLYKSIAFADDDKLLEMGNDPKTLKPWAWQQLQQLTAKEGGKQGRELAGGQHFNLLRTLSGLGSTMKRNLNPVPGAPKPGTPPPPGISADEANQQQAANEQRAARQEAERARLKAEVVGKQTRQDVLTSQELQMDQLRKLHDTKQIDDEEFKRGMVDIAVGRAVSAPAAPREHRFEDVKITLPDGTVFYGNRDVNSMEVFKINGKKFDLPEGAKVLRTGVESEKTPEEKETPEVRTGIQYYISQGMSPEGARTKALADAHKSMTEKQKAVEIKISNDSATGKEITDDELRNLAQLALITKQDPHIVTRNPELNQRYIKIKGEEIKATGGARAAAAGQAEFHADATTLASLTRVQEQMKGALAGTNKEIDRMKELSDAVPLSSFKKFNSLQQLLDSNLKDDPQLAAFREALLAARYRYNSMISNVRGGGAATNQIRTETAEDVINASMARGALNRAADEMKVGLNNIMSGLNDTVKGIKDRLEGGGGGETGGGAKPTGDKAADDFLRKHGVLK